MALRFTRLTRPAIRALKVAEKIAEHGITAARLVDGDVRYTAAVMVDGRRIHRVIGVESVGVTRTQAEEFIEQARSDARHGRLSLPAGRKITLTFAAAADLYLKKLKEVEGKDYTNNEQHIRLHLKPYFGAMRLDQITAFTLQKFQAHCQKKGMAEATANRILATYRRMGRKLVRWRVVSSVLPMIELRKERNARDCVISEEQEQRLLAAALQDANPYTWLFIKLGMATSLRHSEMLRARWDGFDPERRRLRVQVKGGRWRRQPLTRGITEILAREQEMAQDPSGWLFPSPASQTGHIDSMRAPFTRCVVAVGLNPAIVVPHVMRHTAITRLAAIGADIKTIQEFSAHESLAMVLRYAHAQDRAIDSALDRLEQAHMPAANSCAITQELPTPRERPVRSARRSILCG
jgi:integrase